MFWDVLLHHLPFEGEYSRNSRCGRFEKDSTVGWNEIQVDTSDVQEVLSYS
jgi:hypothetical protein